MRVAAKIKIKMKQQTNYNRYHTNDFPLVLIINSPPITPPLSYYLPTPPPQMRDIVSSPSTTAARFWGNVTRKYSVQIAGPIIWIIAIIKSIC